MEDSSRINTDDHGSDTDRSAEVQKRKSGIIQIPSRRIIVEPIVVLFAIVAFPYQLLSEQYIYAKIASSIAENNTRGNITDSFDFTSTNQTTCSMNKSDPAYIFQQEVQAESSRFLMYSSIVMGVPSLLVTLILGFLSDIAGRKYVIGIPIIGTLLNVIVFLIVAVLDLPVWYLLIGSFLNGCCGSYICLIMGCFTYVSDITLQVDRLFRITAVEMLIYISGILGPLGLSYWVSKMGYIWPLVFVAGGHVANLLYLIFFVPETIRRLPNSKENCLHRLKQSFTLFTKDCGHHGRTVTLWILLLTFFVTTPFMLSSSVLILYMMSAPLCCDMMTLGYFTASYLGITSICSPLISKCLNKGLQSIMYPQLYCLAIIAMISLFFAAGMNLYIAFLNTMLEMYTTAILGMFAVLFIPTIRTMMSIVTPKDSQGAVFAMIAFVEVICAMSGDIITNAVYEATLNIVPTFVFMINACVYCVGILILIGRFNEWTKRYYLDNMFKYDDETHSEDSAESESRDNSSGDGMGSDQDQIPENMDQISDTQPLI